MTLKAFSEDNPFYGFEGRDGFHAACIYTGPNSVALSVFAISGGVIRNFTSDDPADATVEVLSYTSPTKAQAGDMCRLTLVADAIARYFTTGGTWQQLNALLRDTRKVISDGLVFPGYTLHGSYLEDDNNYEHLFVHDNGTDAVIWSESETGSNGFPVGGWILSATMEQVKERIDLAYSNIGLVVEQEESEESGQAES